MIAHRICNLRKNHAITQAQLAQALHVSSSAMGMYEQARRTPDLDTLVALSRFFNVSLDYLITGTEFAHTQNQGNAKNCPCSTCRRKDCGR